MPTRVGPWLLLAGLGLLFFGDLALHPGQTLYSDYSDLLTLHLPSRDFLVRSWQETGEVPLWCPYNFAGMPFAHDIQVSAFYPPHWPLFVLPPAWLGAALSWLVVLHVIAAGWCMLAYARHRGLTVLPALVAAVGYMFAGKWLLHILAGGHYNMIALAWLPLVLLWQERALARRGLLRGAWAGAAFGLIVLGAYPYVTLYAGLFVATWTLGTALEQAGYLGGDGHHTWGRTWAALRRWAGLGAWTALVAVALAAVQLLPGLEMSRGASRAAGVPVSGQFLLDGLRSLVGLVGPPVAAEPNAWENRAGLGVLWLAAAAFAPAVGGRRARFEGLVCLGLLGFVLGGAAALQWLPGFNLFRLPSRMFLVMALPVALLAGRTTQAVFAAGFTPERSRQLRGLILRVTAVVLVLAGVFGVMLRATHQDMELQLHPYWLTLLVTVPAALWLTGNSSRRGHSSLSAHRSSLAWFAVLFLDVAALSWPAVAVKPEADVYQPSACVRYLAGRGGERGRVLDFNPLSYQTSANHTPLWPGLPAMVGVEPVRGFNPIDVLRYKEYLQFVTDEDRPLRALDQMFTGPILGTFPIKNQGLADLLGVRFLLQPSDVPLEATVQHPVARAVWRKAMEDPAPTTFNFISVQPAGRDCGVQPLPPYTVYENPGVLPRAFVVPEAAPLPDRPQVLAALKATDFRRRVLLEGFAGPSGAGASRGADGRAVAVKEYLPNRVSLEVPAGGAGYLVLTDVWFPGWNCTVDGRAAPVFRADYVFRAVELPAGAHEVVFCFAPASYEWGKMLSSAAVLALVALSQLAWAVGRLRPVHEHEPGKECHALVG